MGHYLQTNTQHRIQALLELLEASVALRGERHGNASEAEKNG
jgi:hypothetical protein